MPSSIIQFLWFAHRKDTKVADRMDVETARKYIGSIGAFGESEGDLVLQLPPFMDEALLQEACEVALEGLDRWVVLLSPEQIEKLGLVEGGTQIYNFADVAPALGREAAARRSVTISNERLEEIIAEVAAKTVGLHDLLFGTVNDGASQMDGLVSKALFALGECGYLTGEMDGRIAVWLRHYPDDGVRILAQVFKDLGNAIPPTAVLETLQMVHMHPTIAIGLCVRMETPEGEEATTAAARRVAEALHQMLRDREVDDDADTPDAEAEAMTGGPWMSGRMHRQMMRDREAAAATVAATGSADDGSDDIRTESAV